MAKKIIIANWKMNPQTPREARELFSAVKRKSTRLKKTEIVVCPPAVFLETLSKNPGKVKIGGQNAFYEKKGAHTGENSVSMFKYLGASHLILGHSEVREKGEKDLLINKKVKSALKEGLKVVLCIGEHRRDESGLYLKFLQNQIEDCLEGVPKAMFKNILIAYEPIWAIGAKAKGADNPSDFLHNRLFIKKVIASIADHKSGLSVPVLYGGSVNFKNAESFLKEGQADGLLVGRESLSATNFSKIIKIAEGL